MKSLMVCLGNICRSPLAEGILAHKTKQLDVEVDSAGTAAYHVGELPDKRSTEIADKYNINLRSQRAIQFSRADFDAFDVIFAMDTNNAAHLMTLTKTEKERKKIRLLLNEINPNAGKSVPDPYYGGEDCFQHAYNMLNEACDKIVQNIE